MSWTKEVILQFIDLYRKEQILWDPNHPLYRHRTEINEAWLRIKKSLDIDCTVTDLKKKKESLMTSFRFHLSRKRKSPDTYKIVWFAFQPMESFLGSLYVQEWITDTEYSEASQSHDHKYKGHPSEYNHKATTVTKYKRSSSDLPPPTPQSDSHSYTAEVDECDMYCRLLAKKLKRLDEHQRDIAMHEIDNIMFNAKMKTMGQNRSYTTHSSEVRKTKSPVFVTADETVYEEEYLEDPITQSP